MFNHEIKCSSENYFNMYKKTLCLGYTKCHTQGVPQKTSCWKILYKVHHAKTSCRVCHTNVSCIMCYANRDMHNLSCITCYSIRVLQYVMYRTFEILTICWIIIFFAMNKHNFIWQSWFYPINLYLPM